MKILANNPKVSHDYFVEDELIAGVVLLGWEVKAIMSGKTSIKEAYVRVIGGELFIVGSYVESGHSNRLDCPDSTRTRKLLITKRQLGKFIGKVMKDGYTIMIRDLHYSENMRIKATLCLCKGKKKYDKRQAAKERDMLMDARRSFS